MPKKVSQIQESNPIKKPRAARGVIQGIVVSDKMDKTVVVKVDRLVKHPKYHKRYRVSKKYKVHDPKNKFKQGDKVQFVSCRPISKDKKWRVVYDMKHEA
ncbi:MAG: 30S ribosomal protein S17 [Candidatus Moranbacteria bacterium]|nr:30S ribosomal protein S17 [Candidatus Moranbacteria bacterium]